MITQYDARAEIEAMKARRYGRARKTARPAEPAPQVSPAWTNASEQAIRAEMERRLMRRRAVAPAGTGGLD
jgi:hypothetical protein